MFPKYFYNLETVYFIQNYKYAFMDKYQFELAMVPKSVGRDVLVALTDIRKIFAPYMTINICGDNAEIKLDSKTVKLTVGKVQIDVDGIEDTLVYEPQIIDDFFCVPAANLMEAFGKITATTVTAGMPKNYMSGWEPEESLIAITNAKDFSWNIDTLRYMFIALRNKRFGEIYRAFWLPEADKVIPYCMYVPVSYDPAKPNKLLVAIHGGGLGEQSIFSLSKGKVQLLAQKYNYIVLCPNACTMGSSYGSPYPPNNGNKHKLAVNKDSADNPQGFSEETLAFKKLGDISVTKTIELIETLYNIDKDHIYMMGNSMGGMGTIYYAYAHKGMIRAIASSGGVLAPEYFPYKDMTGIPVRIIGGTEDYHGFDYIYEAYQAMEAAGLEVELAAVGGGIHYDAWAEVLEGTFEFFEAHA